MVNKLSKIIILVLAIPILCIGDNAEYAYAQDEKPSDEKLKEINGYIDTMIQAIEQNNTPMRNRMFIKLRVVGNQAVPALLERLEEKQKPGVKEYIAFTLGWLNDPKAQPALIKMLKEGNNTEIIAAAKALGQMQATQATDLLIDKLQHKDPKIRREMAYALGLMRDKKAFEPLKKLIQGDEDELVRFFAKDAIERIETGW